MLSPNSSATMKHTALRPSICTAVAVAMVTCLAALAAQQQAPVDTSTLGPQPGTVAPAFSAPDQQGRTQTLQTIMGPKGVMLVFFRSADW